DNLRGADHARALNHVQTDASQTEHHHTRARLRFSRVDDRTYSRRDTAADVADLVERRVGADFRQCNFRQHGEIGKRRTSHVVQDRLALDGETAGAVGHHALALRGPYRLAEIRLRIEAIFALP